MQSAIERWQELVDARAQQMDAAYARLGRSSADFWDRRAGGFHRSTKSTVPEDPLYKRLRQVITPGTSVLDVGAGTGRFLLPFAGIASRITAVEPNASMLHILRQTAEERGIADITVVPTTWQEAPDDLQADITLCSHVLYPLRDVEPFIAKLYRATRKTCFFYMRATHFDEWTSPFWQHFHGDQRHLPPGYIHALDILFEMGLYAAVEIVTMPTSMRYPTLEIAIDETIEQLILPNEPQIRSELQHMLSTWLVEDNGMLTPPFQKTVCAIMTLQGKSSE